MYTISSSNSTTKQWPLFHRKALRVAAQGLYGSVDVIGTAVLLAVTTMPKFPLSSKKSET
jgi:hypothetical protein